MSDLIRRQDAIDALGDEPEVWNETDAEWAERDSWVLHKVAIESLPSADVTETEECIKCQETTERVLLNARKPNRGELTYTLPDGAKMPIDEESYEIGYTHGQMADRPTGWIPVSERLPKEYAQYLVCFKSGECYVYLLEDSDWAKGVIEKENIIAWMPLPEPYREDGEE